MSGNFPVDPGAGSHETAPGTCPRAEYRGEEDLVVDSATDPAVQYVARCVVAGVDKRHELHPRYAEMVKGYGEDEARRLIAQATEIPDGIDIIQTEMDYGGVGLFGGLSEDGSCFEFYEWLYSGGEGQMRTRITVQEARDIVEGKPADVTFTFNEPSE